jgi:hypothetical protein
MTRGASEVASGLACWQNEVSSLPEELQQSAAQWHSPVFSSQAQ